MTDVTITLTRTFTNRYNAITSLEAIESKLEGTKWAVTSDIKG